MSRLIRQRGISLLPLLIVLSVSAFFLNCAIRLIPIYVDNITVRSTLSRLAEGAELATMTKSEIRRKLNKHFEVNNVRGKPAQSISVEKTVDTTFININYEQRVNIIFNIDAVVVFKNQLDINNPDLCCDPR